MIFFNPTIAVQHFKYCFHQHFLVISKLQQTRRYFDQMLSATAALVAKIPCQVTNSRVSTKSIKAATHLKHASVVLYFFITCTSTGRMSPHQTKSALGVRWPQRWLRDGIGVVIRRALMQQRLMKSQSTVGAALAAFATKGKK